MRRIGTRLSTSFAGVMVLVAAGLGMVASAPPASAGLLGVHVVGNQLVGDNGLGMTLRGVNRMGTEYACIQGWGIFDRAGTVDEQNQMFDAMQSWHANAVRVPLNEDCWLDREAGGSPYVGATYQQAIVDYVSNVTSRGMVAIVDLHWSAPAGYQAIGQQPMADRDNSLDFWSSVASTFRFNGSVIFDLFNEPYLDRDPIGLPDAWACWRDGCTLHVHDENQVPTAATYQAAGMQELVTMVRATGALNPIMLGGLSYADNLDGLVAHLPLDPAQQLVAAWHPYPDNPCGLGATACWDSVIAPVMFTLPVVAGEFGRQDCRVTGLDAFMDWMDGHGASYLAWVWTVSGSTCNQGAFDIVTNELTGTPTVTGAAIRNHYLGL